MRPWAPRGRVLEASCLGHQVGALDRTVEEKLAQIAEAGHGVVTRRQLLRAGITRRQITARLRSGTLLREYPGVYRVGHRAPSAEATYLAAVLAAGDGALLSGRAAGHLWGLVKGKAPPADVTTATERRIEGFGRTVLVSPMPETRRSAEGSRLRVSRARLSI